MTESYSRFMPGHTATDYATTGLGSLQPSSPDYVSLWMEMGDNIDNFWQPNSTTQDFTVSDFKPQRVVFVENTGSSDSTSSFDSFWDLSGYQTDQFYSNLSITTVSEHEFSDNGSLDINGNFVGPTREEIFEEIVRECSELERRSFTVQSAPPMNPDQILPGEQLTLPTVPTLSANSLTSELESLEGDECDIATQDVERRKKRNRAAALRYRERKRKEREMYSTLAEQLVLKNDSLKVRVGELEKEIKYLHGLLSELKKLPQ